MAYADQQMSGNRVTALIIVVIIHVVLGYALVTGLAYSAFQQVAKKLTTVEIKKDDPKKPPPPPPPKSAPPPPIVAPPPPINIAPAPPMIQTVAAPPPYVPPAPVLAAPTAPPAPRFTAKGAVPRNSPASWATTDDYPARALREQRAGTTGFHLTIGSDGRVTGCEITASSGSPDLDDAACKFTTSRARFTPATDGDGRPTTGTFSSRVKWVIPKDEE